MFNDNAFNVIHRQIPPPPIRIKYIALLFHGCGRRAMSFYYSPEGVKITQELLDNNYVSESNPFCFFPICGTNFFFPCRLFFLTFRPLLHFLKWMMRMVVGD